jgi:cytochrome c peroxidase
MQTIQQPLLVTLYSPGRAFAAVLCYLAVDVFSPAATAQMREPIEPIPLVVAADPARVELGRQLFEDVRLSGGKDRSCATCHPLDAHGMDGLPRARPNRDIRILRNTPTIFNVGFNLFFTWNGRFETLAALADFVLQDPALMGNNWPNLLAELKADAGYVARFGAIYPGGISQSAVLDALECFERSLITPNSRFDKYLRGDTTALSAAEQRGYQLFKSYGCVACHQGINVGGNLFQKFGVFPADASNPRAGDPPDQGRYPVTKDLRDRGVFRVPSLRNVAVTAPYFHSGRAVKLEDAVDTMARVQLGRTLIPEENHLIVQFLGTLTGEFFGRSVESTVAGAR